MEDVRLLLLPEQDFGGLRLGSAVSYCITGDFSLRQNWAVHKSYLRPAVLYGSEALCLKESDMEILQRTERSMVSAMCVQLKDRRGSTK